MRDQAQKAMYSMISTCHKFDLPVDMQIELYNTLVLPAIKHVSEIWGFHIIREMEL